MSRNNKYSSIEFIVIGAGKSGTTWLANMLRQHPDIFIPERKELHYFNSKYGDDLKLDNLNHSRSLNWYMNFFNNAKSSQIKGEITPQYLNDPASPNIIHKFDPNIKIIAVLRNPVERTFSQIYYSGFRKGELVSDNILKIEQIDSRILERSKYYKLLEKYYKLFPHENIMVFLFDELKKNNKEFLHKVENFLGVKDFIPDNISNHSNVTGQVRSKFINRAIRDSRRFIRRHHLTFAIDILRVTGLDRLSMRIVNNNIVPFDDQTKPKIDPNLARALKGYFAEDINLLEGLIDEDLSAWK